MHSKLSETISFQQKVASIEGARKVLFVMFNTSTWNMQKPGPPLEILNGKYDISWQNFLSQMLLRFPVIFSGT